MDFQAQNLSQTGRYSTPTVLYALLFLMACLSYLGGLSSLYLPSNGDEMVYSRIARLTAASQQWLPLVSDLGAMRNTKPPLLFWQAMVAGDWGAQWDLWRLRAPAVAYSLGLCGMLIALVWRITRQWDAALLSACVYLAFFSSFRYGRPYLTSAAETFWLTLPLWWVLWQRARVPSWATFAGFGLLWGIGLLYKSFALVLPTAAALWCALLALHGPDHEKTWRDRGIEVTAKVTWSAGLAVAVFALWFVFDPDPAAVWAEFVVGENGGKLATTSLPLSAKLGAVAVQALAWLENAGPLALVVLGLITVALATLRRGPRALLQKDPTHAKISLALAAWALVWLLVFCLPSQRSARYVIPAMPALAVLIALHWQRIPRAWFVTSIILCLPVLMLLTRIGGALYTQDVASLWEWAGVICISLLASTAALAGLFSPRWTRMACVAVALSLYAVLNAVLAPLNGPAGQFAFSAPLSPQAKVAVPSGFNAQHERYQFLLPNAAHLRITPYASTASVDVLTQLLTQHDAVVWQSLGPSSAPPACAQTQPATCTLLAWRWDIKSRHQAGEIRLDNVFAPEQWLLRREWVVVPGTKG